MSYRLQLAGTAALLLALAACAQQPANEAQEENAALQEGAGAREEGRPEADQAADAPPSPAPAPGRARTADPAPPPAMKAPAPPPPPPPPPPRAPDPHEDHSGHDMPNMSH